MNCKARLPGFKIRICCCLSLSRLLSQNTTAWGAYEQQKFIAHSFRGWNSKVRVPAWSGEGTLPSHRLLLHPHMAERTREFCMTFFMRALISLRRALSSLPIHLSKAPLANFISLGG